MNILFVMFAAVLLVTAGLLIMYGLSETPLEEKSISGDVSKSKDVDKKLTPFPNPSYEIKPTFISMKTVISARAFKYNASTKRITLGDKPNMYKWSNIEYPLNFTHARFLNDRIFEFTHPNSSDSSGKIVQGKDESVSFNTIEFGMFF